MKDWHPDKIQGDDNAKLEAEEKSKAFIEAYHLLVSIAPETQTQNQEKYTEVIESSKIVNFDFKSQTLKINFADGSCYEFFSIPKSVYNKFLNSDKPDRFARRHIYHEYLYRLVNKADLVSA